MKKKDVPQDNNRTYGGHKKVIYAVNSELSLYHKYPAIHKLSGAY